ncbi:MAG: YkgJ family cysteine cluster protein [Planctomycetota bacterium]
MSGETTTEPWYREGLKFECTRCGNCCTGPPGYVWFSPEEGRAIAKHLGVSESAFLRRYAERKLGRWSLTEVHRGPDQNDCVFLTRDEQGKAGCSVYPVRPTQCQTWPFWPSNLESQDAWDESAAHCPGMRSGKVVPLDQVRITAARNEFSV